MTLQDVHKISLNVQELAFITGIKEKAARDIFREYYDQDRLPPRCEIPVAALVAKFDKISSLDPRYDGLSRLELNLMLQASRYKTELRHPASVRAGKFVSGRTVFNKICTPDQIRHAEERLQAARDYLGLTPKP